MTLGHSTESEGYETMTQHSSDLVSEVNICNFPLILIFAVLNNHLLIIFIFYCKKDWYFLRNCDFKSLLQMFHGRRKVMDWLEQQPDVSQPQTVITSAVTLLEATKVNHIVSVGENISFTTTFSVSEISGSIAITSLKPSLSIMHPGTDKPITDKPILTLSRGKQWYSVLFISISDQEYLAIAFRDNLYLWNSARNTSSVAYKFQKIALWHLCVIDENTISCGEELPSADGISKVYILILNTDSKKFTLSNTLHVKSDEEITDMCHAKMTDGAACLLLSSPYKGLVQCVEMVGGKLRWQVYQPKMGGPSLPWSICTDGSTVFVLSPVDNKLNLLSIDDGSMITTINLRPFGVRLPSCIRLYREHMCIGHMDEKRETYCISKFTKPLIL